MRVRMNLLYHTQLIEDIRELVIISIIPCDEMPNAHAPFGVALARCSCFVIHYPSESGVSGTSSSMVSTASYFLPPTLILA